MFPNKCEQCTSAVLCFRAISSKICTNLVLCSRSIALHGWKSRPSVYDENRIVSEEHQLSNADAVTNFKCEAQNVLLLLLFCYWYYFFYFFLLLLLFHYCEFRNLQTYFRCSMRFDHRNSRFSFGACAKR